MIKFNNYKTINKVFYNAVKKYPNHIFLSSIKPSIIQSKKEFTFREVHIEVKKLIEIYKEFGVHLTQRVAIMLGNNPIYFFHKIALNILGVSCVPINPESKYPEILYIIKHSESVLMIGSIEYIDKINQIAELTKNTIPVGIVNKNKITFNKKINKRNKLALNISPKKEASLLYTSGTSGKPKGCILSHEYEIESGLWYANIKGIVSMKVGKERLLNPLPVHHINSSVFSFFAVMITGNCQIQLDKFHASSWWKDVSVSKATIIHYLGIIAPVLMKKPYSKYEKNNCVRIGVGAGIEPTIHEDFEKRFGFPMVEIWGMTEMVRCLFDYKKSRNIGKRCFGSATKGINVKIINNEGKSIIDKPGEMLIRYDSKNPSRGFFSGYLKDARSTKKAWKGGWFHTGDLVTMKKNKKLFFVDRKKNIIRRSGENISSSEVEAIIQTNKKVLKVAVVPYKDKIYDEEVFACIVLKNNKDKNKNAAISIFNYCKVQLSNFKLPAYIFFMNSLPITDSQKIKKQTIIDLIKKNIDKDSLYDLSILKKTKEKANDKIYR